MRLVSANRSSPIIESLTDLVLRTFGPVTVLERELRDVAGVVRAEIFGSWAARYQGERGGPPGDIDVLVIGEPDRDELYDATSRAERVLGREVNLVIVTRQRWEAGTEPFLRGLRSRPRVGIVDRVNGEDSDVVGPGARGRPADDRRR
jgi:predicted nucleotidyltransferase